MGQAGILPIGQTGEIGHADLPQCPKTRASSPNAPPISATLPTPVSFGLPMPAGGYRTRVWAGPIPLGWKGWRMNDLILGVFLSDFMIFVLMGLLGLMLTIWAFSVKEYAGYALGWLVGIFLIIVLSTLFPRIETADLPAETDAGLPVLGFFSVVVPGGFGIAVGFALMMLIGTARSSSRGIVQALTIAILMTINLVSGYLMLLTIQAVRLTIAIFVLAMAIGALSQFILTRYTASSPAPQAAPPPPAQEQAPPPNGQINAQTQAQPQQYEPPRVRSRFEQLRRRYDSRYRQPGEY